MNAKRLDPHRRELQVDQHRHVDIDDDGLAWGHRVQAGFASKDLLDDGHAHELLSFRAYLASSASHSAIPTRLKNSAGPVGR